MNGTCSRACGGGTQRQVQEVSMDDENVEGETCANKIQHVACNTQDCPINCTGNWSCGAWRKKEDSQHGSGYRDGERDCEYVVSQSRNSTGTACPHAHGEMKNETKSFDLRTYDCRVMSTMKTCYSEDNMPWA